MDSYTTLTSVGEAQYTEKRSRFLAFAMHVESEEEIKTLVTEYRKKYYDARHVCYAYALGYDGEQTRANDDGEPGGSAGKPILGQLRSHGITEALVIVVRYFGGVKLGTGGLAVAYKTAAAEALESATTEERLVTTKFRFSIPYTDADTAMRFVRDGGGDIIARDYTETATILTVSVRDSLLDALRERLTKIHTLVFIED